MATWESLVDRNLETVGNREGRSLAQVLFPPSPLTRGAPTGLQTSRQSSASPCWHHPPPPPLFFAAQACTKLCRALFAPGFFCKIVGAKLNHLTLHALERGIELGLPPAPSFCVQVQVDKVLFQKWNQCLQALGQANNLVTVFLCES